ncbi:MAG TPA: histidinol-phosphatase [Treponemataceae bacterium]|nr:histidinol-phosphatase [Treponemataceae bacterium]
MLHKTNYHTHSTYCDGDASIKEMVQAAIKANLSVLGFSTHALYPFGTNWHIQPHKIKKYCEEITSLKKTYADTIELLIGFEVDYLPPISFTQKKYYAEFTPDFLIGSVHYIYAENHETHAFSIDGSCEELENGIKKCFNGNAKKAVQSYFASQRDMIACGGFDIMGHIDVIRKLNGKLHFFNENDTWYKKELKATAKTAAKSGLIAEINTGGMARAGLKTPYPSPYFLSLLNQYDVPIMINSDAHTPRDIAFGFEYAANYAREIGYTEVQFLSKQKWQSISL